MKKQHVLRNVISLLTALVLLALIMFGYAFFLKIQLEDEIITSLVEISGQSVTAVNSEVDAQFTLLDEISANLTPNEEFNVDTAIGILESNAKRYDFHHIGVALPTGIAMLPDGTKVDISSHACINKALTGTPSISNMVLDRFDNTSIVLYATPIREGRRVCAALFACIEIENFKKLIKINSFNGEGYTYIITSTGDAVADSDHPTSFSLTNIFENMLDATPKNKKPVEQMKEGMLKNQSGYVVFNNKVDKYMYYTPIGINDWYLAHVVPKHVLSARVGNIMQKTYIICAAILFVAGVVTLYWHYTNKKRASQLNELLYTDPVTGGRSHSKFLIDVGESLSESEKPAAMLSVDLNNFKLVNEIFGRDTGDVLLWFVHSAMSKVLPRHSIYARGMADRFYALVYYDSNEQLIDCVETLCEYIVKKAPERFQTFILKPSVGIYRIKNKDKNVQEMLNSASFAKNSAKHDIDKQYAFYTDEHRSKLLEKKQLADELEVALKNDEFEPFFQPQYKTENQQICGAEALMRWRKEDGTLVPPGLFIPLAEANGFISQLDENMFAKVCKLQRELIDSGIQPVPVSVNMSRQLLYDVNFIERYIAIMEQYGLSEDFIELEITETALFENQDKFLEIISKLHNRGFKILMDDFGTGYSSLMMLKSIPIDIMKLDKTFIDDYDDEAGLHIIKCVTDLAKSLNISVIAEGVEQKQQYELLKELRCDVIQGYYFSKPVPFEEYKAKLMDRQKNDA